MDASVASDPNESQATQLLQELLENNTESSKKLSDTRSSELKAHSGHSNEISSDSLPSTRHSNSLPQYHFHGLASTQSQSQLCEEEEEVNEGSQKENIGTSRASKGHPASRPSSPHASSSNKAQSKGPHPVGAHYNPKGSSSKKASSAAVSFPSPTGKNLPSSSAAKPATRLSPYKPSMSRYNPSRRAPSPADSTDSFACDPEKPEDQLAKSDKFAVPLSELGQHSSPVRDSFNATGGLSNVSSSSYARNGRRSPPTGKVLVEATPSYSGSSQHDEPRSLSQQLKATQLVDGPISENQRGKDAMAVDKEGSGSGYESSEPSSSYGRFLDGERKQAEDPGLQQTQPSEEVSGDLMAEDAYPTSNVRSAPAPSGPQSLMSLVPQANRYRYRKFQDMAASAQASNQVVPPTPGQLSLGVDQETQPSFDDHLFVPPGRSFPPPPSGGIPGLTRTRQPSPELMDIMDVVPDSEPMGEMEMRQTPKKRVASSVRPPRTSAAPGSAPRNRVAEDNDVDMDAPTVGPKSIAHGRQEEEEEEDEDEEDEDIPLAAAYKPIKGQTGKKSTSKGKAAAEMPPPRKAPAKSKAIASLPVRKNAQNQAGPSKIGRSWETSEIPSSVPEQDQATEERKLRNGKTSGQAPKPKANKPPPSTSRTRRGSRSAPTSAKPRITKDVDAIDESDDPLLLSGQDDTTEPADEEYQEDEEETGNKKRKRAPGKSQANAKSTRVVSRRGKRNAAIPVPQAKRLRSALSTGSRANSAEATRVFALWRSDCHYYPGTVHSTNTDSQYFIKFDDDTDAWVDLKQIRLCQLRVGDDVLVANRFRPSRVVNVDNQDDGYVHVNIDDEDVELQISSLRIASKTIMYDWTDRILAHDRIVPLIKPVKTRLSPSPSKMSMLSVPSMRGSRKKVLSATGLIVTLSANGKNWEREKETVMSAVKNSGGFVVDDLDTIIRMDGKHSQNNNVWIIKETDVEWIGDDVIERLFLIADVPNQKPKFLIALALGIPCLATHWLHESVESGEEKDWLAYLLPQGYSTALNARPSQQVDMDWGNSVHDLTKIMRNAVPCKLFANKTILCVGPEMVPQPKGKRRAGVEEKTQEAMNALPRIILAMGAKTVEAVTESRFASKALHTYDYVVLRETTHYSAEFATCTTVHWAWVKECLIASRLLPLPSWPSVGEHSQEA